jgi:hypothetical protein
MWREFTALQTLKVDHWSHLTIRSSIAALGNEAQASAIVVLDGPCSLIIPVILLTPI